MFASSSLCISSALTPTSAETALLTSQTSFSFLLWTLLALLVSESPLVYLM